MQCKRFASQTGISAVVSFENVEEFSYEHTKHKNVAIEFSFEKVNASINVADLYIRLCSNYTVRAVIPAESLGL